MIYFHGVCSTSTVFSLRKVCHLCIGHTYDSTNALRDRTDWTGGAPQGATLRRQENQTVNQWGDQNGMSFDGIYVEYGDDIPFLVIIIILYIYYIIYYIIYMDVSFGMINDI